ncbi:hypothetical protein EVAR_42483_1 [Eumeta japonica]|uniref:Histone-lysine N-methyltransferase SETMAR n=1 Tax=Eumeta variegata TaxID=151549 RepID=A0A4C1XXJ3_EUMVA|nr:hypothetical protein EVAR_42483_1 [Eumeta japonica]
MVVSFFGMTGHYATTVLEDKTTATAARYNNNYLRLALEQVREKRPRSKILFHHDEASPHITRQRTKRFDDFRTEIDISNDIGITIASVIDRYKRENNTFGVHAGGIAGRS